MALAERELKKEPDMIGWSVEQRVLYSVVRHEGTRVTEVADAVGKSHSTISQYISGTYASPRRLDKDIRQYLISIGRMEEDDERYQPFIRQAEAIPEVPSAELPAASVDLVITKDFNRVLGVCRQCYNKNEMGMITGNPGTGKTYAFSRMESMGDLPHVVVSCDETTTPKSILVELCEALDLPIKGASPTLKRRIVKDLQENPRLLIVDEADLVKGTAVYESIRSIYDKAGCIGVVLCGNNNLAERILLYAEDRPELARLRDRIGYYQRLRGLSPEEAAQFVDRLHCTASARQMLIDIGMGRGIRQLVKAMARCADVGQEVVDAELVEELGSIVLSFSA